MWGGKTFFYSFRFGICGDLRIKLTKDRREVCLYAYRSVQKWPAKWLKLGAYIPNLIGEEEWGGKASMGKTNGFLLGKTNEFLGQQTGHKVNDNVCLCWC